MKFRATLVWLLVVVIVYGCIICYQNCFPPNSPGWEFHHNRTKSGNSPEDIMRMYGVDPATQEEFAD